MNWHQYPLDDAWRRVTLKHIEGLGQRLWLHCGRCRHQVVVEPGEFAVAHRLPVEMPLLTIGRRLRCTGCGERKGQA